METKFIEKLSAYASSTSKNSFLLPKDEYSTILQRLDQLATDWTIKKEKKDYKLIERYDIMEVIVEGQKYRKLVKKGTHLQFVTREELFGIIEQAHLECSHGGPRKMHPELSDFYANITFQQIEAYIELCEICQQKKKSQCINSSIYSATGSIPANASPITKEIDRLPIPNTPHSLNFVEMEDNNQEGDQQFESLKREMYWKMAEKFGKFEKELAHLEMEIAGLRKENAELKEEMAKKVGKFERQISALNEKNRILEWQIKNSMEFVGNEEEMKTTQESQQNRSQILERIHENGIDLLAIKLEENGRKRTSNIQENIGGNYPSASKQQIVGQINPSNLGEGSSQSNSNWAWKQMAMNGAMADDLLMKLVGGNNNEKKRTQNASQRNSIQNNKDGQQQADKKFKKLQKCKWPGCRFRSKFTSRMTDHIQIHTGEKAGYLCEECGQTFDKLGALKVHERVHTGERPYACQECGLAFTQIGNLKRHLNRAHNISA